MPTKYLFADESGNFDFRCHIAHKGATRYFAVGTLMIEGDGRVAALRADLHSLRDTLVKKGHAITGPFHCTTDTQSVRDAVFEVLRGHDFKVDVTLLEKAKALPRIRTTDPLFYKYAWYYHFKYFANRYFKPEDELLVVSAGLGTKRTKTSFRTAVEEVVSQCCNWEVNKRFGHWNSGEDPALQAIDYVLWAVMRDIERGDDRSRRLIEDKISSVYDLWAIGKTYHYGPKAAKIA